MQTSAAGRIPAEALVSLRRRLDAMPGKCRMAVTDDETETVSFSVVGVERVLGRGELVALAIVELALHGVAMTLQGIQVRHMAGNWITVTLPAFKHPRDGMMRTAIVLPKELGDAIGSAVADAYDTLGKPTLAPDPSRGVTRSARL